MIPLIRHFVQGGNKLPLSKAAARPVRRLLSRQYPILQRN
jgi:hypothetical protein